ncbi:hypothetical protein BRDCF_p754 [Bacteroidales bacterium CF]|nr:hypothetical protein BRDCF_p754 [Bacteroidales bacterium CF]
MLAIIKNPVEKFFIALIFINYLIVIYLIKINTKKHIIN